MIFRYARHSTDLNRLEKFYTQVVGLENLGGFQNHDDYDGLFLGLPNMNWHIEFTTSSEAPMSQFDEDDALVFYVNCDMEFAAIKTKLKAKKVLLETPKNPYWQHHGVMVSDPDGCKVIFTIRHLTFQSDDALTHLITQKSIENWSNLIDIVQQLPYGRNANRHDFSLVLTENKGTCSSKHALLKKVADLNKFEDVKLILGIYKMNDLNTPGIGSTLKVAGLEYLPEAHCYLKLNNQRIDITSRQANFENIASDILEEREIDAEQVTTFKVEYHQQFLKKWLAENDLQLNFDELWAIRESCIQQLER
jgi:hypothetical protein